MLTKRWYWVLSAIGDATPKAKITSLWIRGGSASGTLTLSSDGTEIYSANVDSDDFAAIPMNQQLNDITIEAIPTGASVNVFGYTGQWGK